MEIVKQLGSLVEQATSDSNVQPPVGLYQKILEIINSRVDMPKHTLNAISKRLSIKNKKVLFYCFDLLQYLSYHCELALYSQISTKEFLLKLSGLLMSQQLDPSVQTKVLLTIKCWQQLFRPHEDLLPMFFQFYAGILRKQFPIQKDYVSIYRPKDFKVQRVKQQARKQEEVKNRIQKPKVQASKSQQKTFEQIRQKIILTNEIIQNANPAEGVKSNALLLQMMEEIKVCEKKINQTINQNPNQKIMELALAANDDIYITYRRFKDLQKNRKPQPFILTQLPSDYMKSVDIKEQKKIQQSFVKSKKSNDEFDNFNKQSPEKKVEPIPKKAPVVDIFDLACEPPPVKSQKKENPIDLLSLQTETTSVTQSESKNANLFDLLGVPEPQVSQKSPPVSINQPISANIDFMNSNYLGLPANNTQNNVPVSNNNFQSNFQGALNLNQGFQSNAYGNINLSSNTYTTENDLQKYDDRSLFEKLTDLTADLKENRKE